MNVSKIVDICADNNLLCEKLREWGVLSDKMECSKCGYSMTLQGNRWRCRNKIKRNKQPSKWCTGSMNLFANSFFHNSKLTVKQVMIFVNCWVTGIELNNCAKQADISLKSASSWASFCREVTINYCFNNKTPIGGPGHVVEIDESKFGRRKFHRGHYLEGQWIFGGVDRNTGHFFMVPVEKRDCATLISIITEWIKPGTTIHSDWQAYDVLGDDGYDHLAESHSLEFKNNTKTIEGMWRHVKAALPQYKRIQNVYCGYLSQFMFTTYCKRNQLDATIEFLRLAGQIYRQGKLVTVKEETDNSELNTEPSGLQDRQELSEEGATETESTPGSSGLQRLRSKRKREIEDSD